MKKGQTAVTAPTSPATPTKELFTASDLARFCQVDLKTIHNWTTKGELPHLRTPGRHLRFRRSDVLDFLRKYKYPIPAVLRTSKPSVIVIDDDPRVLTALDGLLSTSFEVTTIQGPIEGLVTIGLLLPDVLIFDISMLGLGGIYCLERLRAMEPTAHIRCVIYSQHHVMKEAALGAGACDFILKGQATALSESLVRLMGLEKE